MPTIAQTAELLRIPGYVGMSGAVCYYRAAQISDGHERPFWQPEIGDMVGGEIVWRGVGARHTERSGAETTASDFAKMRAFEL